MTFNLALDPRPKLRNYLGSLSDEQSPSGLHILVWSREHLEYLNDNTLTVLRLYGHWSVHTRLTGSQAGYEMLAQINHQLILSDQLGEDVGPLATAIASQLATARLRSELRSLLARDNIPAAFLESHKLWNRFLASVFDEIRGKPIQFPAGESTTWRSATARSLYDSARAAVVAKFGNAQLFVRAFMVDIVHVPEKHEDPSKGSLHWICITEGNIRLRGELIGFMFENGVAFQRP